MKYYIKKINKQFNSIEYKQYKCIDGWNRNKNKCWQFSRKGAEKIITRLRYEYRRNINNLEFEVEEV